MLMAEFLRAGCHATGEGKGKGASDCNWGRGEGKVEFQEQIIGK